MHALVAGHRLGPYRIVRLLGEGGMGAVYEGRQEPLERRVAIKTLHPELAANENQIGRFFNEAKILSKLEHPSIVQISDFGNASDGTAYLVMEYLQGESLARRLHALRERGEKLPVPTTLQLAWQVADVLAIAHALGIIHRALKTRGYPKEIHEVPTKKEPAGNVPVIRPEIRPDLSPTRARPWS